MARRHRTGSKHASNNLEGPWGKKKWKWPAGALWNHAQWPSRARQRHEARHPGHTPLAPRHEARYTELAEAALPRATSPGAALRCAALRYGVQVTAVGPVPSSSSKPVFRVQSAGVRS